MTIGNPRRALFNFPGKPICRRQGQAPAGFSLIEQALVLPILLVFILGAMDINDAMQAHTALKEGAKAALRCEYTVDGKCVSAAANPPAALYNWYDVQCNSSFDFNNVNHDASFSFLEYPTTEYLMQARVLNRVNFDVPRVRYEQRRPFWAAESAVRYRLLLAEGPYLAGGDPHAPKISYIENDAQDYPSAAVVRAFNDSLINASNRSQVVARFRIPRPIIPADVGCVYSDRINRPLGEHSPQWTRPCSNELRRESTRIAIHLRGRRSVGTGKSGHIIFYTEERSGNRWIDRKVRGGQVFGEGEGQSNFYPRGISPSNMDKAIRLKDSNLEDIVENYRREWREEDQVTIVAKYNTDYRIVVEMDVPPVDATINWKAMGVDIYTPIWSEIDTRTYPCDNPLPADMQNCSMASLGIPANLIPQTASRRSPEQKSYPEGSLSVQACADAYNMGSQQPAPVAAQGYDMVAIPCGNTQSSLACPPIGQAAPGGSPNFGVSDVADANGYIRNSSAALAICSPYRDTPGASSVYWTQTISSLPGSFARFSWAANDCSTGMSLPSSYQSYPQLLPPQALSTTFTRLNFPYTTEQTPRSLKQNDPRFRCQAIKLTERQLDESLPAQEDHDCIFKGNHPDLGACTEERLRADAEEHHHLQPSDWFVPANRVVGRTSRTEQPADICTPFNVNYQSLGRTLLTTEPLAAPQMPTGCDDPGRPCPCEPEYAGFNGSTPSQPEFDVATASQAGLAAIQAAMPRARDNCSGDYCVTADLPLPEQDADKQILRARFSMQLPMRLLLNRTVQISHSGEETWEGEMVE